MPGFWDDPELKKAAEGGDYIKFISAGDTAAGTVKTMKKRDFEGRTAVEVEFDDDRKVTFGQVLMLRELFALQPEPGEFLSVTLADVEKKGAKTLKLFKGSVTRKDGKVEEFDQTRT
jgi:hypothetical protein